jgi:hypothetical protein
MITPSTSTTRNVAPPVTPNPDGSLFGSLTIVFDRDYMGFPVSIDAEYTEAHEHATPLSYRSLVGPQRTPGSTRYVAHFPRVVVSDGDTGDGVYRVVFNARSETNQAGISTAGRMMVVVAPNIATVVDATQFRPTWL